MLESNDQVELSKAAVFAQASENGESKHRRHQQSAAPDQAFKDQIQHLISIQNNLETKLTDIQTHLLSSINALQ